MRMAEDLAQEEVTEEEISLFKPPFKVGDPVWDFELPDMEGRKVKLSNYKGKVILLFFFATWCPYCSAEAPYLEKEVWQKLKDKGVQVITVDVKEGKDLVDKMIKRFGWTMPVLFDTDGMIADKFAPHMEGLSPEVAIINAHFIIDKEQRIRSYDYLNMEKFDAHARRVIRMLEQALKE